MGKSVSPRAPCRTRSISVGSLSRSAALYPLPDRLTVRRDSFPAFRESVNPGGTAMIRVKDLKDQIGKPGGPHPMLYCPKCGDECSATAGDYFMSSPDRIFKCCRRNMLLVIKRIVYDEVTP